MDEKNSTDDVPRREKIEDIMRERDLLDKLLQLMDFSLVQSCSKCQVIWAGL